MSENIKKLRKLIYLPMVLIPKSWSHRDKYAHALIGTIIYGLLSIFFIPLWSLVIVAVIAYSKELLDKYVINGTYDLWDFIATIFIPLVITVVLELFLLQ